MVFLKSEMDDVSINKEALLLIETSLLRLGNLGPCRWKPHVEFRETTCGIFFTLASRLPSLSDWSWRRASSERRREASVKN